MQNEQKENNLILGVRKEYPFFEAAIKKITSKEKFYDIHTSLKHEEHIDISHYYFIFQIADENALENAILSLTKTQIEVILCELPKLLEIFHETRITLIFRMRYRKYMFRILYLLWQDYYDRERFHNLFLYVLNHPKSVNYVKEVNFSVETLRSLVLAKQVENKFVEIARSEKLDMREFLSFHKINRDSIIAIDVMGIFFLFCSAEEYIEIGSERVIIALMRSDMKNQAKILSNMIQKLSSEDRIILKDVFRYFYYKYNAPGVEINHEFWKILPSNILEAVQDEFNSTKWN